MLLDGLLDVCVSQAMILNPRVKEPRWSAEEREFLRVNHGRLTDGEMAAALGRTENAIKIKRVRMRLEAASKAGVEYLTVNQAADVLGVASHALHYWCVMGLLPTKRTGAEGYVMLVSRKDLTAWVVNPDHWIYFDWKRITDGHLRRLCELRAERWGDEWWTTVQVAEYHGVEATDVCRHVAELRTLPGVQCAVSRGGRNYGRRWSYWYVRRSDAVGHRFNKQGRDMSNYTPRGDAWILRARDERNMSFSAIARTMGLSTASVNGRYKLLKGAKDAGND